MISLNEYLALVLLLAAERLGEVGIARRNARRAFAAGAIEVGAEQYPVMALFHALFLVSAAAEAILLKRSFLGFLSWAALALALAAQALRYWCVATLGPFWNTRIIVWPGKEPVNVGPYRYLRHPNYLAVVIEMACVPLIRGCWMTASLFSAGNAMLIANRIRHEEASWGSAYIDVFARRPRLIPSVIKRR